MARKTCEADNNVKTTSALMSCSKNGVFIQSVTFLFIKERQLF